MVFPKADFDDEPYLSDAAKALLDAVDPGKPEVISQIDELKKARAEFVPGDQVIYIPTHAHGSFTHPDNELGFITSVDQENQTAFVRYFAKGKDILRTQANSERTDLDMLYPLIHHANAVIAHMLRLIQEQS
jgi:hypothetical protein